MRKLKISLPASSHNYQIAIGRGLLNSIGKAVRDDNQSRRRVVILSNPRVYELYGPTVAESLESQQLQVYQILLPEGERTKSLQSLAKVLKGFSELRLERSDAVVALGGGVVGDIAGFAAAVYLRGVTYFQVPTTLLSQIDSSVGGKTGVNLPLGKNLVGAFHQPGGVVIDPATLSTLPARELTAGFWEMVKNGAVGGRKLFTQTTSFLRQFGDDKKELQSAPLEELIAAHCSFKAGIVKGDEREEIGRTDHRSRRILNFGHTVGHALEAVTKYRRFRHGEAVAYGMLVAIELSKLLFLLQPTEVELLDRAVRLCGQLPKTHDLDVDEIFEAVSHDKKNLAGKVQWVLLERIGRARIVSGAHLKPGLIRSAIGTILQKKP
ncbi:MAG TPA: 3-dehydroquinate synthase [Pyrinomonadaceae bacterium]|nr:3-dehydroquinate synthase [Pyrinomonadaceae bacterium]